ncbi:MAG: PEGA domain protein [Bacteroidetes bacterium ADurb.Bin028]|nr:MAG: PEGA domain protein [Bacteroidetes bacterium ADurb.Bin028]
MFKFFYIIIVFCFLQLISIQLKADKFQVESFTKDEKDIAARKAELKDINDDYCAIIKVRTNVDGILFKTYPDITKIEYKSNPKEIWLYVSPGIKLITMSGTGFVTQEYVIPNSIKVESLSVYVMVVKGVYDFTGVNTNDLGYFKVISNPPGAQISMEGNPAFKEYTPYDGLAKKQQWPIGKKRIFVELKDYNQKDTVFLIEKDKVNEININLVPAYSYVDFKITPKNATIRFEDKNLYHGKNKIFKTNSELLISAPNYYDHKQTLDVPDGGDTQIVEIELIPITGTLSIIATNNNAIGADIFIDEILVGTVPLNNFTIQQGEHKLKVSKNGLVTFVQNIKIIGNQENSYPVLLDNLVSVKFASDPWGASIFVDDKFIGTTPLENKISLGAHNIRLEKTGYNKHVAKFDVKESTTIYECKLTPDALIAEKKNLVKNNIMRYSSVALFGSAFLYSGYQGYTIYDNYQKYQVATDQATQLHQDIITSRNILFVSGSVAVLSGVSYFIFQNKYKKSKSRIQSLSFIPTDQGIYFSMKINF